jgi:pyrimidine-specific ribonucleoside hydrolase
MWIIRSERGSVKINIILMKRLLIMSAYFLLSLAVSAHPWKPSHYVIVDTDGGIDDIRTISMLLASPDVRLLAVTVSNGALPADKAFIKVKSLLNSFHHEGIPVGINRLGSFRSPEFPAALNARWGDEEGIDPSSAGNSNDIISEIIRVERTKLSFICLGSMSTALNALRNIPEFGNQVKDFIWSADGADDKTGFNYNIDAKSSVSMLKQEIPVKIVRKYMLNNSVFWDNELTEAVKAINTRYAKAAGSVSDFSESHRFALEANDEMTALFLHYPELFICKTLGNVTDCIPSDPAGLRENTLKILKGETVPRNQVIKEFSADPDFYFDDLSGSVTAIIEKHGIDEFSSSVISNELHRHLGVFTVIGVKMGIRAREYFATGVDEFHVRSLAGSTPPISCFNDGIQVSTGATPGHGLLTVVNDQPARPAAEFTYYNRTIRLSLKPELAEKVISELKEFNFVYGLDSNTYWELVRKNSIKYWLNMDRNEIFDIEVIK